MCILKNNLTFKIMICLFNYENMLLKVFYICFNRYITCILLYFLSRISYFTLEVFSFCGQSRWIFDRLNDDRGHRLEDHYQNWRMCSFIYEMKIFEQRLCNVHFLSQCCRLSPEITEDISAKEELFIDICMKIWCNIILVSML